MTQRLRFPPLKTVPPGRFRRVPPAIFPPVLGLLGLALAWRASGLSAEVAGLLEGVAVALALFGWVAYASKIARRPGVLAEELAILPGRAGVGAAVLTVPMAAAVIGGHWPGAGRALLALGLALHLGFWAVLIPALRRAPAEQRRVSPVWHLHFTGIIIHARAALALGLPTLAGWLTVPALVAAVAIYAASAAQLRAARVPAPLRPLLAIHLAPLALAGTLAAGLGYPQAAAWLGALGLVVAAAGVLGARWLLAAGVSPLWGALTFPLAALAGLWQRLPQPEIAGALLALATIVVLPVAAMIWREWAQGRLPVKTNAAIA